MLDYCMERQTRRQMKRRTIRRTRRRTDGKPRRDGRRTAKLRRDDKLRWQTDTAYVAAFNASKTTTTEHHNSLSCGRKRSVRECTFADYPHLGRLIRNSKLGCNIQYIPVDVVDRCTFTSSCRSVLFGLISAPCYFCKFLCNCALIKPFVK